MLLIHTFGRLGNNILQIIKCCTKNIRVHNDRIINITLLKKSNPTILYIFPDELIMDEYPIKTETITNHFWDEPTGVPEIDNSIIERFIKPYIDYELTDTLGIDFDHDLIIHVRSGDIIGSFMANDYKQPPLLFYNTIITNGTYKNIYILSEQDNINPVIPQLLELHKNCTFLNNSIEIDFKIMLNAKYFVNACSTLSIVVNMISKDKSLIYYTPLGVGTSTFPSKTFDFLELYYKTPFKSIEDRNHKMIHYGRESYRETNKIYINSFTTMNYFATNKMIFYD
jgi:hypothetical protein